jgi:hypothetical protein
MPSLRREISPEYEAGVPSTRHQRSVCSYRTGSFITITTKVVIGRY